VRPVADRQDAPDWPLIAIRIFAFAAPWMLRRVRTASMPVRLALFLGRVLPVTAWLLRQTDHSRPAGQPLQAKQRVG
jgi:hypothetical protein